MVCTVAMSTLLPDGFGTITELESVVRPLMDGDDRRVLLTRRINESLDRFLGDGDTMVGQCISGADVLEGLLGIITTEQGVDRETALRQLLVQLDHKHGRLGGFEPGVVFEA